MRYTRMLGDTAAAVAPGTVAAIAPKNTNAALATNPAMMALNKEKLIRQGIPAAIAAYAAYRYGARYGLGGDKMLNALVGAAVGYSAYPLATGSKSEKMDALAHLAEAGAGYMAAKHFKKYKYAAFAGGAVASYMVAEHVVLPKLA